MPIGIKLMLGYSCVFGVTILLSSLVLYSLVRGIMQSNIESELKNTTATILNMVHTAARSSIRSYLRGVAETNLGLVSNIYAQYQRGEISEQQAKDKASRLIECQKIGQAGYLYCVDSKGVAVVHPRPGVASKQFLYRQFVREQIQRREGYLEYDWQNPGEKARRAKALYMVYFKPWDWIISVTTYRDEFKELVKKTDFRQSVLSLRYRGTGYSFVVDGQGNIILHPKLQGNQLETLDDQGNSIVKDILRMKGGKLFYNWRNPGESDFRRKLLIFDYIPEFDWVVASSCYLEEYYAPLLTVRKIALATVGGALLLAIPITFLISASITRPLKTLMKRFRAGAAGDLTVRMKSDSKDEVGQLAYYFNKFMEKLSASQRLERELLEISEREHQRVGRNLHDDLCPHLIGVEVMTNVLEQKLRNKDLAEADSAAKIKMLVGDSINKLRRLARGLCPMDLGGQGIDSSLGELTGYVEDVFGVSCSIQCEDPVRIADQNVAANIYYIVHEALHNAVKHAHAKNIRIFSAKQNGRVVLKIEDDGAGMPATTKNCGMGLRIMRYRAQRIGAKLSIGNRAGGGTVVTLEMNGPQTE